MNNLKKIVMLSVVLALSGMLSAGICEFVYGAQNAPISGEIERIFLNDPNDHWSGGEIVVGGQNVIIPRNLLIDLPANRLTLKELFDQAPAACVTAGETGLAKADACNVSKTGAFASIAANITNNGNIIAGDVLIEKGREVITGNVTYIDYTDGYFRLDGIPNDSGTGVMVRLNDPDGRHTIQQGLGCAAGSPNCSPDPRFTLDPDNYTNVFSSGFPLCIPSAVSRSFNDVLRLGATTAQAAADGTGDVLCPAANRTVNGGQPVDDSRRFAPIMQGDNITAEGNFETINGIHFLSAHTTMVGNAALTTKNLSTQPDYLFLDEVEVDAPGFQNERARTLIIGYTTKAPTDVLIWSLHYDPLTNQAHEFPLATVQGCDTAAGTGTCGAQGLVGAGANIFKIRHDVDFIAGAKPRLNPCAHLQADPRIGSGLCPNGGASDLATPAVLGDQMGILSPIMHEIQARTGHALANPGLITLDIKGNTAKNGQYLFPFGMNLGGISTPEFNEINLDALNTPFSFSGIPWLLDRRLSPAGCIDTNGDGAVDCETTPQPLDPFPFEGTDPRTLSAIPQGAYNDPNFTNSSLTRLSNRIFSFVTQLGGGTFNFDGNNTVLSWPPVDPALITIRPTPSWAFVNIAPIAVGDIAVMDAGVVSIDVNLTANDVDVDGVIDSASVVVTQPAAGFGTVLNLGNGSIRYTPSVSQSSGTVTFTYTVNDSAVAPLTSNSATVTVLVTQPPAANVSPTANNDSASATTGAAVTVNLTANDTDADGSINTASVTIVSLPSSGSIVNNADGTVTYTSNAFFSGIDTFTYTVADNLGALSNIASVTVIVSLSVNAAPVAVNDVANAISGTATVINVLANDTDADGTINSASVVIVSQPANGAAAVNADGTVTFTSTAGFIGPNTFTYNVRDNLGALSNTATVTVTINPVEVVTVTRALFRISGAIWVVRGTDSLSSPANTMTVKLARTGQVIGTTAVDTLGNWSLSVRGSAVVPQAGDTVSATSSNGATASLGITIIN